eukprot:15440850-Alexandrium_andersonii.AAC.1
MFDHARGRIPRVSRASASGARVAVRISPLLHPRAKLVGSALGPRAINHTGHEETAKLEGVQGGSALLGKEHNRGDPNGEGPDSPLLDAQIHAPQPRDSGNRDMPELSRAPGVGPRRAVLVGPKGPHKLPDSEGWVSLHGQVHQMFPEGVDETNSTLGANVAGIHMGPGVVHGIIHK